MKSSQKKLLKLAFDKQFLVIQLNRFSKLHGKEAVRELLWEYDKEISDISEFEQECRMAGVAPKGGEL